MRSYFDGMAWPTRYIESPLGQKTNMQVVIPAYKESYIEHTITSLSNCAGTDRIEVLVVVNGREGDTEEIRTRNLECLQSIQKAQEKCNFPVQAIMELDLPKKHAGAGLARKIGMDEAAFRFRSAGKNGIIICLDADCEVDNNYLVAIERYFKESDAVAGSVYYEHQTTNDPVLDEGIINYELHLRCYVQGLRYAGYPFAYHTVGSSMAVRSEAYIAEGGMNRRKAGEDFYFLQKIMQLYQYGDICETRVMPSNRVSDRVPFGTGKAQSDVLKGSTKLTYHPQSYNDLRIFMESLNSLLTHGIDGTNLPKIVYDYLDQSGFKSALEEARRNTADYAKLRRRIFQWFNGLRTLQFFHFARESGRNDVSAIEAAVWILEKRWNYQTSGHDHLQVLTKLREFERGELYQMVE